MTMSLETAQQFVEKANSDEVLKDTIRTQLRWKTSAAVPDVLAALGKTLGYDFTPDDIRQLQTAMRRRTETGPLSTLLTGLSHDVPSCLVDMLFRTCREGHASWRRR